MLRHEIEQEGNGFGTGKFPLLVRLVMVGRADSGISRNVVPMLKPQMGGTI